jgi:hypothetical protein
MKSDVMGPHVDKYPETIESGILVDDKSLQGIGRGVIQRWWVVALGALLGLAIAIVAIRVSELKYASAMTVVPVVPPSSSTGGGSAISGLASLAGITSGSDPVSAFDQFKATLYSSTLAEALAKDASVMRMMFPDYLERPQR